VVLRGRDLGAGSMESLARLKLDLFVAAEKAISEDAGISKIENSGNLLQCVVLTPSATRFVWNKIR
jgi:hypothetical protein